MTEDDSMPLADHVYRRSKTPNLYFRIKVPADLLSLYRGKQWAHGCSLRTSSVREANHRAAQLEAQWQETFRQQREQLKSQTAETLTPEVGRYLARKLLHEVLATEEARLSQSFRKDLLRSQVRLGLVGMQIEAADAGIVLDEKTPGAKEAWLHYINELDEPLGAKIPPQQPPMPKLPTAPRKLRDVFDRWKVPLIPAEGGKVPENVRNKQRWLKLYEQQTGNPPLHELTKDHGEAFRAWLLQDRSDVSDTKRDWSSKRKHMVLDDLKSLLNYAKNDLDWIIKNPWQGLDVPFETEKKRRPVKDAELKTIFSQPLFTTYELPNTTMKNGGAAAYWLPLLGLYTGARVGELAQLRTADVQAPEGIPAISINTEGEGKRVKTEAGERLIPLHPELLRLDFLEYVADIKKAGEERLWPALQTGSTRPGTYFSTWFADEVKKIIPVDSPTFHYFRHGVRTKLARARVPEREVNAIMGHKQKGVGNEVYTEYGPDMLLDSVKKINYPALNLPRAYKARAEAAA